MMLRNCTVVPPLCFAGFLGIIGINRFTQEERQEPARQGQRPPEGDQVPKAESRPEQAHEKDQRPAAARVEAFYPGDILNRRGNQKSLINLMVLSQPAWAPGAGQAGPGLQGADFIGGTGAAAAGRPSSPSFLIPPGFTRRPASLPKRLTRVQTRVGTRSGIKKMKY
jgi:hypothetical protein